MTSFIIGALVGGGVVFLVAAVVVGKTYERGGEDMIETLARRRRGPSPLADDRQEIDLWGRR